MPKPNNKTKLEEARQGKDSIFDGYAQREKWKGMCNRLKDSALITKGTFEDFHAAAKAFTAIERTSAPNHIKRMATELLFMQHEVK